MTLSAFLRNPAKCRWPKASPLDSEQALPPCTRLKDRKPCVRRHGFLLCGTGARWCVLVSWEPRYGRRFRNAVQMGTKEHQLLCSEGLPEQDSSELHWNLVNGMRR